MYKSKLILLLKTFSADEIRSLGDYLKSPYFNKNKSLIRFYSVLKNQYPEFEKDKISKEILYKKLFPGNEFNEQVIKNLTSDLFKHSKKFLTIESFQKDKNEMKLNLLKQLVPREADPVYYMEVKKFENDLQDLSGLTEKNFYYLYQLEDLKISFHLLRNEQPKVFEKVLFSGEYLLLYFHMNMTKTISNLYVNKFSFKVEYKTNLPEIYFKNTGYSEIIKYMKDKHINFAEIFEMYYLRVISNTDSSDDSNYFEFKRLLFKNLNSLGRVEIYGLFISLEAYCIKKIHSKSKKFITELFNLYSTQIEKGFYKYSESSPVTFMKFRNTCMPALILNKFDWVEKFVEQFKNDIIESDRKIVVKIAYAQINFGRGDFQKVIELLAGLNPEQIYHKMDIRNLTVMSYFELGFIESTLSFIDSFRHFITGSKSLPDFFKKNNLRFINSLNSFILLKEKSQLDKISELKESLKPYSNEIRIQWLINKIDLELK